MKRTLAILVAVCAAIIILLVLLGGRPSEPELTWEPYVVRPGDTLYDIAAERGADNPEKYSYEVCEKNGIPYGGLIFPGEVILVYGEVVK